MKRINIELRNEKYRYTIDIVIIIIIALNY
jgi:hypothetical protein